MNINDIMNTYKERMWLIMCKRNNINPWDLIDKLQVKVYITYKLIGKVEAKSKYCLICGTEFSIQRSCGSYVLETICKCAHDGSSTQTLNKWKSYMPEDEAITLIKEANYKRCKGIRFSITHWLQKGYSLEQAKIKVAKIQKELNKLSPSSKPGARFSRRTKEYWIRKGFTEEESKEKVKEVQTTNGMEFYTKKYGAEQGKILFENQEIKAAKREFARLYEGNFGCYSKRMSKSSGDLRRFGRFLFYAVLCRFTKHSWVKTFRRNRRKQVLVRDPRGRYAIIRER